MIEALGGVAGGCSTFSNAGAVDVLKVDVGLAEGVWPWPQPAARAKTEARANADGFVLNLTEFST